MNEFAKYYSTALYSTNWPITLRGPQIKKKEDKKVLILYLKSTPKDFSDGLIFSMIERFNDSSG